MSPLLPLILFQLGLVVSAQKMVFLRPSSIPQCDTIQLQWTGGTPPFTMSIAPTDDSGISSASFEQDIVGHTTPFLAEWPAGTKFTATVNDDTGQSVTTDPPLIIGPSSNSTCLDPDFLPSTTDPNTDSDTDSQTATSPVAISSDSPLHSLTSGSPSSTHSATATDASSNKGGSQEGKKGPDIAIIIGVVAGVSGLLGAGIAFLFFRRRLKKRSSRENFVKTWGDGKGLDGEEQGRPPSMAIPDPFIYTPRSNNSHSNLIRDGSTRTGAASVERNPTTSSRSRTTTTSNATRVTHVTNNIPGSPSTPGEPQNPPSPTAVAARKGERYLPDFWSGQSGSQSQSPQPQGSSTSRIQDEDIDRLAARMVALMSSGRMNDQSWTPSARGAQQGADPDLDDEDGLPGYIEATRQRRSQQQQPR